MIAVVGGGISGLATAWYLAQAGRGCTLIEKQARLGGVIDTSQWEGCVLEGGPDSFLAAKPEAMQLIRELGIENEAISSNDHQRVTFIWKNGRMVPLPDGLMMMVPTKIMPVALSPLLSWRTKIRMGLEYVLAGRGIKPERSVAQFVREHYGQETVDYLAEPLLSGVYGGNPEALSVNAVLPRFIELETKYGSLTRGVLEARKLAKGGQGEGALFRTMKRGLGHLVETLQTRIADRTKVLHGEVEAMERAPNGWRLRVAGDWMEAEQVVLAVPAYHAAALLAPHDAELGRLLHTVDYSSSMTIALVYRNLPQPPVGFGFLVPKRERRKLMAGTWVQNKFPHRAPEGYSVLRCFIGGPGSDSVLLEPDDAILRAVLDDVRVLTGVTAKPDYHRITRWRRSMAQYTLGHSFRLKQIDRRMGAFPKLLLAGNAYSGIGISDCIRTGKAAAGKIIQS
ncbi:MAG: protoporphyrinogen oxidase [Bryobacterales bacterium]|nr:protoporphyrinogen oxidase [Bryobacterales bacterium]